ncbi:MAG: hypothetical protein JST51_18155 [Armatimonadetes bacterium]|nr:hypothetical protein [Armatimonadota bacterium]
MTSKRWRILETLLEAGAAISVIAILSAALYPLPLKDGRSTSSACLSNIKQITLAEFTYQSDFDDTMPPFFTFDSTDSQRKLYDCLYPYIRSKSAFLCPQNKENIKFNEGAPIIEGIPGLMSYVHCHSLQTIIPDYANGQRLLALSQVAEVAATPVFREGITSFGFAKNAKTATYLSPHGSSFVVGYFDGHAKRLSQISPNKEL